MAHPKQLAHDSEAHFEAFEALIDDLLKSGRIDYAKFEPVADDAEAVAALVREAVGRDMLAALAGALDDFTFREGVDVNDVPDWVRVARDAIARARIAGIRVEG